MTPIQKLSTMALVMLMFILSTYFFPAIPNPHPTLPNHSLIQAPMGKAVATSNLFHPVKSQAETPPANPTPETPPANPTPETPQINVDDPSEVETTIQELTDVTAYTIRDVMTHILVALGAILLVLLGAVGAISYIALKFLHRSVTPEAVKDIFLLGVSKGVEGLTDVAKRVPIPYELDDKFVGAIASGVGRYFAEIGYTPTASKQADPPPDTVPLGG